MGGTHGPICQLQLALLQLQKKTLCQNPITSGRKISSLEKFNVAGGLLEQTTTTNLWRTELAKPRTPRQLLSFLPPFRKSFLCYHTSSTCLEHRCKKRPPWLRISCFSLLFAGAKTSKLQLRFGDGRKHLQQLSWWKKKSLFKLPEDNCTL